MLEAIPITRARNELLPLIERVNESMFKFIITRQGKPAAVVLSYDEYSRMVETLNLIQDKFLNTKLHKGLQEAEEGHLIDYPVEDSDV